MICMCRSIRTARRFIAHDCAKCCHSGIRKAGANVLLLGSFRCTRPEGLSCRHDPSDGADRSLPRRRRRHALLALLLSWSDADELSIDFGACVCRMCPMIAIACNHVVVTTRRRCMLSAACRLPHVAFRMVPYDRHRLQPCASHRRALYQRAQTALGRSRNSRETNRQYLRRHRRDVSRVCEPSGVPSLTPCATLWLGAMRMYRKSSGACASRPR